MVGAPGHDDVPTKNGHVRLLSSTALSLASDVHAVSLAAGGTQTLMLSAPSPFDGLGARRDADYIRNSILNPNSEADPEYEALLGVMPPNFGQMLSEEQLNAIVDYLAGLQ